MKLSLIGMLTLATAGCGGTTGWVPPGETANQDGGLTKGGNIDHPAPADAGQPDTGADASCGPECTGAGLYDSCTGLWGTCADSLAMCGVAPAVCQANNICYRNSAVALSFAVECDSTDFTWTDTSGVAHDCHDGTKCPAGTACTVNAPGIVAMTGTCF